jgi:hypothetical protein
LIKSIAAHGQFVPALGRPICDDPKMDVEILCGSRRLFAARHLDIPLLVQVRDLSDRECALVVELENSLRKSLPREGRDITLASAIRRHPNKLTDMPPKMREMNVQHQTGTPRFITRRYFNVIELVFPRSINEFTIELVRRVVADFLNPQRTPRARRHL